MSRVLNVFQTVAPRGTPAPSAAPRQHVPGRPPARLRGSTPRTLVMDARGLRRTPLGPRSNGAFAIESRAAAQASIDKRRALVKGGI